MVNLKILLCTEIQRQTAQVWGAPGSLRTEVSSLFFAWVHGFGHKVTSRANTAPGVPELTFAFLGKTKDKRLQPEWALFQQISLEVPLHIRAFISLIYSVWPSCKESWEKLSSDLVRCHSDTTEVLFLWKKEKIDGSYQLLSYFR